jgi:hypothetical protein
VMGGTALRLAKCSDELADYSDGTIFESPKD